MEEEAFIKKSRSDIQLEAKEAAIRAIESTNSASLLMGTGTGKGLTILQILDYFNPEKITWLIDSTDGRDINDSAEFYKWGYEHLLDRVTFSCYQTAYKWEGQDLGFLVLNEADYAATEAYSKCVSANRYDKLLMATATIAESKQWFFDTFAPVVYSLTTQEAEDLGIVNKTIYKFIHYDLSIEKNITIKTKTKEWKTSDNDQYLYWDNQFIATVIQYDNLKREINRHFNVARIPGFNYEEAKTKKLNFQKKLKYLATQRANVLYNSITSIGVAQRILRKILADNEHNKVVCFSKFTEHIDKICKYTWHSKNSGSKKDPNINKDLLNAGDIRELGVVGKINRGANLVGVNHFLFETFDGSSTVGQQRGGRGKRLGDEEVCTIWVMIPYFYKKGKRLPTRAYSWSATMLSDFNINESNSEIIDLNKKV